MRDGKEGEINVPTNMTAIITLSIVNCRDKIRHTNQRKC